MISQEHELQSQPDTSRHVLVVDDEPAICWAFEKMLTAEGHHVVTASSVEQGLACLEEQPPDLILLDVRLPGQDGISALPQFLKESQNSPIIVMTAFGDLDTAVTAIRNGASDYITKPFSLEEIQLACENALAASGTNRKDYAPGTKSPTFEPKLVGSSRAMQTVFKQIALVSNSDLAVLITGETGTGKELAAAAIHRNSHRKDAPYLPIAPAALNPELIESELFGHVKGAFTGATEEKQGVFEQANGGTVLLDEIGDLPMGSQVKLLRILDQRQYFRVGDVTPRHCDVRILAATNCDLQKAVANGTFREDLFYRLNGLRMHLPPLRERREDIENLVVFFLEQLHYPPGSALKNDLIEALQARPWHGNIRELRNAVEHAAVVARGRALCTTDFPEAQSGKYQAPNDRDDTESTLHAAVASWCSEKLDHSDVTSSGLHQDFLTTVEPTLINAALDRVGGNRSKAATLLGMHRGTLRGKLKE